MPKPRSLPIVPCAEKLGVDYTVKNTFVELVAAPLARPARALSMPPALTAAPGARKRSPSVSSCVSDMSTPDFQAKIKPCGPFDRGYNRKYDDAASECSDCSHATADLFNEDKPRRKLLPAPSYAKETKERKPKGKEPVTTLMVRNLPIRTTVRQIFTYLDDLGLGGMYDFLHFPVDMRTRMHTGYAFVNFLDVPAAERAAEVLQGTQLTGSTSKKIISVCPATRQGVDANLAALEKSCALTKANKVTKRSQATVKPPELPWIRCETGGMKQITKW